MQDLREGGLTTLGLTVPAAAALGSQGRCRKHPRSAVGNAAGRNSGAWQKLLHCFMLPCLKFYQVLRTAGTHKVRLKPSLRKSRSAFLEDYRDTITYGDRLPCIFVFPHILCINACVSQIPI